MEEENFDLGEALQKRDLITEVLAVVDLDPLTREQERNRISEEHNVRKSVIDQFIKEFKKQEKDGGTTEIVTEVEPAKESISGDKLLSAIKGGAFEICHSAHRRCRAYSGMDRSYILY